MPIYEYECENCGKFDKLQKFSDEALKVCPTCGGKAERIISKNVGIVFKGSGWYATDSKVKDRFALNKEGRKTKALRVVSSVMLNRRESTKEIWKHIWQTV